MAASILNANGGTYTTTQIEVLGNKWTVTIAENIFGKSGIYQITIRKCTNNPFGMIGKDFPTWAAVYNHYKSAAMKVALVQIELGI